MTQAERFAGAVLAFHAESAGNFVMPPAGHDPGPPGRGTG
jgi:hypothetical protein